MTDDGSAELDRAGAESSRPLRRLWLIAGIGAIVERPVFLVGGAAVDLHTGSYQPTDVDLVGAVTPDDRRALVQAGFVESGGRHLRWDYPDGTSEYVEFPESSLDGSFERIQLSEDVFVNVITVESLVVDRLVQATDGTDVTFDEALRLILAAADRIDWIGVTADIRARAETPYLGSIAKAHEILLRAGLKGVAEKHFSQT